MEKNENVELKRIIDILFSKKLLIIIVLIIFTLLGYLYSYEYVVPEYKSTSTLLLIPDGESENKAITTSDLTVNSGLISTYSNIAKNSKVLNKVIENLNLDMTQEELLRKIQVTTIADTYIIEISVSNVNQQKARDITKELADVFLDEIKQIYNLNNIGIIDEANYPEVPYNINHMKDMITFFGIGLFVSLAYVMVIYIFDNTIKKEEDIEKYINIKLLGTIPIYANKKQEIIDRKSAKSYVTECINTIRTNILYMNADRDAKTILVTSCTPKEGKSWVSSNIAAAFAQTNKKVLLIDGDMRKGRTHKIFGINNKEGLSNYLYFMTGDIKKDISLAKNYIKETKIPNLHILTNGTIPPNPSELIDSENMKELIAIMKNIYDIVIFDAPPCMLVTDSIVLSTLVDSTILVVNSDKTKINDLNEVKKSIKTVGGKVIGCVLNKRKIKQRTYKSSYYYGYGNTTTIEQQEEQKAIISVTDVIKEAIPKLKEKNYQIFDEENIEKEYIQENSNEINKENIENKETQKIKENEKNNINLEKILNSLNQVTKNYSEILKQVRIVKDENKNNRITSEEVRNIIQDELQKDKQNKEEISKIEKSNYEEIIKQLENIKNVNRNDINIEQIRQIVKDELVDIKDNETENITKNQVQNIVEQVIEYNNRKLLNSIKSKEETTQQVQFLLSEKMSELQQEILKIDYTDEIKQINELISNLKDSYLELSNKMISSDNYDDDVEQDEEEINNANILNLISFRDKKKNQVYSIQNDISYSDLEKSANYIISFKPTKESMKDKKYSVAD